MGSYPLVLDLAGRRAVVVGGGAVALRRVRGLLEAGADVQVVAPSVQPDLAALPVSVLARAYAEGDLEGAWVVHACTDDAAVNAAVAAEAERRRVPCVRADAVAGGSARTPAVARAAGLVVAVASDPPDLTGDRPEAVPGGTVPGGAVPGGAVPGGTVPGGAVPGGTVPGGTVPGGTVPGGTVPGGTVPGGAAAGDRTAGDRTAGDRGSADPGRVRAVRDAVALLLETGELPVRRRRPGPGRVALVGGGPGDPELITVRGRRLLAEADVVVVDRLAPRSLLAGLPPGVEVLDVGKAPHGSGPTQEEISAVLVDRARRGLRVVRLKGGDPFVFGRGGEEVLACVRAGVPVEVVAGLSSALAGPAAAGIPVTHRGVAADFAVVSGHLDPGRPDPTRPGSAVDWQALADGPATLVLLMALDRLGAVAAELVKRGRPATTPVAVVRRATLPDQQILVATLETVAAEVTAAGLRPPAVIVVGEVVGLRDTLWGGAPPG